MIKTPLMRGFFYLFKTESSFYNGYAMIDLGKLF